MRRIGNPRAVPEGNVEFHFRDAQSAGMIGTKSTAEWGTLHARVRTPGSGGETLTLPGIG
jgi:hypothetical protein